MSTRATRLFCPLSPAQFMSEERRFRLSPTTPSQCNDGKSKSENVNNNSLDFTPSPRSGYSDSPSDISLATLTSPYFEHTDISHETLTSPYFEHTTTRRHTQKVMDGIISPGVSPFDSFTFVEDTINIEDESYSEYTTDHHTSIRLSENAVYDEIIRITTQVIGRYSDEITTGSFYSRGQDNQWDYPYEDYAYTPDSGSRPKISPLQPLSIRELTPTPTPRPERELTIQGGISNNILPRNQSLGTSDTESGPLVLWNQPLAITEINPKSSPGDREPVTRVSMGVNPSSRASNSGYIFGSPRLKDGNSQPRSPIVVEHKDMQMNVNRKGTVEILDRKEEETEPRLVSSHSNVSSPGLTVSLEEKFTTNELTNKYTNCSLHQDMRVPNKECINSIKCNIFEEKSSSNDAQEKYTNMSIGCNLYQEMGIDYPKKPSMEKSTNCNFYEEEGQVRDSRKEMIDRSTNYNFYEKPKTKASTVTKSKEKKICKVLKSKEKVKDKIRENQILPPLKGAPRQLKSVRGQLAAGSRVTGTDAFHTNALPTSDRNAVVKEWLESFHEDKHTQSRKGSEGSNLMSKETNQRPMPKPTALPDIPRQSASLRREAQSGYDPRRSNSDNTSVRASNPLKLPPIKSTSVKGKPKSTQLDRSPFLPSPLTVQRGNQRHNRHAKVASKPDFKF